MNGAECPAPDYYRGLALAKGYLRFDILADDGWKARGRVYCTYLIWRGVFSLYLVRIRHYTNEYNGNSAGRLFEHFL